MSGRTSVPRTIVRLALCLATALAAPGCVTSPTNQQGRDGRAVTVRQSGGATGVRQPGGGGWRQRRDAVDTETCARQLHAIAGAMLLHYAVHHRLPDTLDGLQAAADIDQELVFTCPVSGQRYGYNPTGLEYPGKDDRLIVYDPMPSHAGTRWGILASPARGTQPPRTYVVQLPEGIFRVYQQPIEIPAQPAVTQPSQDSSQPAR